MKTNKMSKKNDAVTKPVVKQEPNYWQMLGDSFPTTESVTKTQEVNAEGGEKSESVSKIKLKLQDIQDAHNRIKQDIIVTPLIQAKYVGRSFCKLYLKCEQLQYAGSFKARGVCNVISSLTQSEKSKGCTICGGRNFLTAMTYYGHKMSVPMNVVLPKDSSLNDRHKYKENYGIVKISGNNANEASLHALSYCDEIGSKYIHGADRLDLIAGYGTMGLELLTQLSEVDAIVCPVGSGGLVASLVLAVKSLKPSCLIYGVECAAAPLMSMALKEKKPVMIPVGSTMADSMAQVMASYNAYNIIRGYMDRLISVDESMISRGMITLLEREKVLVEGAAAVGVAAILAQKMPELKGKNVVCILTGGNINTSRIARALDRGMAADGRLMKVAVTLPDVPGALAKLLNRITETGADVRSLVPERAWMKRDIFNVSVNLLIETGDINQSRELQKKMLKEYPNCHFIVVA